MAIIIYARKIRRSLEMWFLRYACGLTDGRDDRHADRCTPLSRWGEGGETCLYTCHSIATSQAADIVATVRAAATARRRARAVVG